MNKLKNTTLANSAVIVQFIHPGLERPVECSDGKEPFLVPWVGSSSCNGKNTCSGKRCGRSPREKGSKSSYDGHSRRLVIHDGEFVNEKGNLKSGKLAFWTEWEAETRATRMPNPSDSFSAKWWHTVVSPLKASTIGPQNTDPCVFGNSFKYCCCQQRPNGMMEKLAPGSLIVFGSHFKGKFVVDTVFVTSADGDPYESGACKQLKVSGDYRELTLKRLGNGDKLKFYRGKTFQSESDPFSFVPAKLFRADDATCGKRFILDVSAINALLTGNTRQFSPTLTQKFKVIQAERQTVFAVWSEILRQVRETGFVPAVHFDWPK